jgi:putative salt-induced outer membrane protein
MKTTLLASAVLLALPLAALAADPPPPPMGWSGSGEAGLSIASGNTKSQNLNAKLDIKFNDDQWTDDFYLTALRNKANVATTTGNSYDLTANRYEAGASLGYKLDERSYIVGAARYEHDEFSSYDYQYIVSIGYGYQILKNASDELAVEVGPGYKVAQPTDYYTPNTSPPPDLIKVTPDSENNLVARQARLQAQFQRHGVVRRHVRGRSRQRQQVLPERRRPRGEDEQQAGAQGRLPDPP